MSEITPSCPSFRKVLVCEDHPFVQLGIESFMKQIAPHCELHLASTGKEALSMSSGRSPDIALIDLGLPDMPGVEVIKELKKKWADIKILVVTSCDNPSVLLQTKKLGVSGIMQKASSLEHLQSALRHIEQNHQETFLDPVIRRLLQERETVDFTTMEYEVLQEIVKGYSNQQIADELGRTVYSIRFHRANILSKANVRSAAELTAWYLQGKR